MGYIKHIGGDKYQLTVTLGTNHKGKKIRKYKTITASSYDVAVGHMEAFEEACQESLPRSSGTITFGDMVNDWREDYASLNLKKSTLAVYERLLERNFDAFKDKPLKSIRHRDVQKWVNSLSNQGLSPKSVKNNYCLLQSILKKAVKWEELDKNPADNIDLPTIKYKETESYSDEEVADFLAALDTLTDYELTFKVGFLLALFGGLRKAEICGLDRCDIDHDRDMITIRQTRMVEVNNGVYQDTPKSVKSCRKVTVPHLVIEEIDNLIEYQETIADARGDTWIDSPALLRNEIGSPLYPQVLYRKLKRFIRDNHLTDSCLHHLRHTHASMLIADGADIEEVRCRLGHAQATTTINIYTHLFRKRDDEIAERLQAKYLDKDSKGSGEQ